MNLPGLQLLEQIGIGGMSVVWKARNLADGRIVAVKILNDDLAENLDDIASFQAEARVLQTVHHPGIVAAYDSCYHDDKWYYVMEYLDGYTFGSLLDRKRHLPESDCLLICESVAAALDYAWNDHGVVHCDLKPDNIMINTQGVVKLTDLGLCHTFMFLKDGRQAVPDHIMGTPAYISPEQVFGDLELDCRSDIYSLAATLYHLATGRVLFPDLSNDEMMRAHCDELTRARDPRLYRPTLSEGFCQLLEAMLVKNRDARVQSWQYVYAMCRDIEAGVTFKPRASSEASSIQLDPMIVHRLPKARK